MLTYLLLLLLTYVRMLIQSTTLFLCKVLDTHCLYIMYALYFRDFNLQLHLYPTYVLCSIYVSQEYLVTVIHFGDSFPRSTQNVDLCYDRAFTILL